MVEGFAEVCYGAIRLLVDPGFALDRLSCSPPSVSEKEGYAVWCAFGESPWAWLRWRRGREEYNANSASLCPIFGSQIKQEDPLNLSI